MRSLLLILVLAAGLPAEAEPVMLPIVGVPEGLRGVWVALAFSEDGGSTVTQLDPPSEFLFVTASSVTDTTGIQRQVLQAHVMQYPDGRVNATFMVDSGTVTAVSVCEPINGRTVFLAQIFKPDYNDENRLHEVLRAVFEVRK